MADMNIGGVGMGAAVNGVNDIDTEVSNKTKKQIKQKKDEFKQPSTNEDEQVKVEIEQPTKETEKNKDFGDILKGFITETFGKKSSGWKEFSERKKELLEQKQAYEQEMMKIIEEKIEIEKTNKINDLLDKPITPSEKKID